MKLTAAQVEKIVLDTVNGFCEAFPAGPKDSDEVEWIAGMAVASLIATIAASSNQDRCEVCKDVLAPVWQMVRGLPLNRGTIRNQRPN